MSENVHDRALQLVAKGRVEGLEDSERDWLAAHLQDCGFCNEHADGTHQREMKVRKGRRQGRGRAAVDVKASGCGEHGATDARVSFCAR